MEPQNQQPWQQPQQPQQPPQPAPQPTPLSQFPGQPIDPQSQSNQQYTTDYLDQISSPVKQPRHTNKLIMIIFVLLGLLILVGIGAMLLSGRPSTLDRANELSARLESLAKLSQSQHRYLRDNDLRASNTAYTLFLGNAVSDLEAPLAAAGIEKNVSKAIEESEKAYVSELSTKFEDARLKVTLDVVYANQMSYELDVIQSMMRSIYNNTSNAELRGFLDDANNNLTSIDKSFEEFSASQ